MKNILLVVICLALLSVLIPIDPTGYAVKDFDKGYELIGQYTPDYDFYVKTDYDINIFEKIRDEVIEIQKACDEVDDKKNCVSIKLKESDIEMKLGPQDNHKAEIINFVEQLYYCYLAPGDCHCVIEKNLTDPTMIDTYKTLQLSGDHQQTKFYSDVFEITLPINHFDFTSVSMPAKDDLIILEKRDKFERVDDANLPECSKVQDQFILSVPNQINTEHIFFDKGDYVYANPPIEFAIKIRDRTPPKQIKFNVESFQYSKNKVLITFKEAEEEDVAGYHLFYNTSALEGKPDLSAQIDLMSLPIITDYDDYENLQPECLANGGICEFKTKLLPNGNIAMLETDKLYYFKNREEFALVKELTKNTYNFVVLASDTKGNILSFDEAEIQNQEILNLLYISPIIKDVVKFENGVISFDFENSETKYLNGEKAENIYFWWMAKENLGENDYLYHEFRTLDPEENIEYTRDSFDYFLIPMHEPFDNSKFESGEYAELFLNDYYQEVGISKLSKP